MSQDDLLSQEEIDALLKGVSGDEEPSPASSKSQDETKIRPYDPSTQHRVIRERLHALDFINERFARYFRNGLFNLIRRSSDITVESVRYQSFSDFSRNVPVPTNLNIVSMKPMRGSALVVFPPNLVFMVVDNLFGGDGRFVTKSDGREFTNTEQRIDEGQAAEFMGIINYCVMALIQVEKGVAEHPDLDPDAANAAYTEHIQTTFQLMEDKNHDYGEAWRDMRVSSLTDLILQKLLRVKQIEDNNGKTLVSEGIAANYQDIINYAVFALIHLEAA